MKKLLLLLPLGLFAASGIYWLSSGLNPKNERTHTILSSETLPQSNQELFTYSEHQFNAILRHGNKQSIVQLNQSLNLLSKNIHNYKSQGYDIQELEDKLSTYQNDTAFITSKLITKLQQLHQYSQSEQDEEAKFLTTLEQIGLYDLKKSYNNLDTLRKNFIKEPTKENKIAYDIEYKHLNSAINDLYLDRKMEEPLYNYITNHKNYFETLTAIYDDVGYKRISYLHENSYAIKAQLQLLPTS